MPVCSRSVNLKRTLHGSFMKTRPSLNKPVLFSLCSLVTCGLLLAKAQSVEQNSRALDTE